MKSLNDFIKEGMFDVDNDVDDVQSSIHFQQDIERILKKSTSLDAENEKLAKKYKLQILDRIEESGEPCDLKDVVVDEVYAVIPDVFREDSEIYFFRLSDKSTFDSTLVTISSDYGFELEFDGVVRIRFIEAFIKNLRIRHSIYQIPLDDLMFMSRYDRRR